MFVWGGNFVVVKGALSELPPVGFTLVRFLIAAVVLLIVCRILEGSVLVPRADVPALAALGVIGFGIYQTLWTLGLRETTAGDSALLIASTPIMTLLVASAIGADVLTPARLVGAAIAFGGVALVVLAGTGGSIGGRLFGDALTLIAAACWAVYVSFGAPFLRRHSPLRTTAWAVCFGCLVMLPFGAWQLAGVNPRSLSVASPLALLYAGLASVALGNPIQLWAVKLIGPTRTVNLQFLVPVIALVFAALVLREPIHPAQAIGGGVILLGILVARGTFRRGFVLRGI